MGARISAEVIVSLVGAAVTRIQAAAAVQQSSDSDSDDTDESDALDGFEALQSVLTAVADECDFANGYEDLHQQIEDAARHDDAPGESLKIRAKLTAVAQSMVAEKKSTEEFIREVLDG